MKTHVKLLVLAMVLVMFTFCLAACVGGGTGDPTTVTTTEAPAATTTTGALGYNPDDFAIIVPETVGYNGKPQNVVLVTAPGGVRDKATYAKIDLDGNVLEELGSTKPTDCGTYRVTVTFSWQKADKTDPLPAAMTADFTIVPGSLEALAGNFGAADAEILFKTNGMDFDPTKSAAAIGFVPAGVERVATIQKLADKNATSGTPTTVAGKITSDDTAGYYLVTFTYKEAAGLDNFSDEDKVSHSAVITAREIKKTIARVDAITLDGVIDDAYGAALFETEYQAYIAKADGAFDKIDAANLVDPYTKAAALRISRGANITDDMERNAASAKFYAAWDGAYVYIAIVVTDETAYARATGYTGQPNPWVNDNLELYYSFGGDAAPDVSSVNETYPTYKTVVRDSVTGAKGFTAIKSQKSHYFDQDMIDCYVKGRELTGDNTYVIEYKLPAKSESWSGTPGSDFATAAGKDLVAGDFIFLAYQLNDLMGVPTKRLAANGEVDFVNGALSNEFWASIEEYDANISALETQKYAGDEYATSPKKDTKWYNFEMDAAAYVYSAGNRGVAAYLKQPGCAPMIFQLGE